MSLGDFFGLPDLSETDPVTYDASFKEKELMQRSGLEMIASENVFFKAVFQVNHTESPVTGHISLMYEFSSRLLALDSTTVTQKAAQGSVTTPVAKSWTGLSLFPRSLCSPSSNWSQTNGFLLRFPSTCQCTPLYLNIAEESWIHGPQSARRRRLTHGYVTTAKEISVIWIFIKCTPSPS